MAARRRAPQSALRLTFAPMTEGDARVILQWRYEEPYAVYNGDPDEVASLLDPANRYFAARDVDGDLVAFCCFGPDARVRGGDYPAGDSEPIDVGAGMRPDLTGAGRGLEFLNAVLDFARSEFSPSGFRATVATFNRRALRVCERAGFRRTHSFVGTTTRGELDFAQLTRNA